MRCHDRHMDSHSKRDCAIILIQREVSGRMPCGPTCSSPTIAAFKTMNRKIFLAFSYQSDFDKNLANDVQALITSHGLKTETGEVLGGDEIPAAVRSTIEKCDGLVALLTRRQELANGNWTTHDWVRDEINFARAQNKKALAIIESGVAINGMYQYHERVPFERDQEAYLLLSISEQLRLWKDAWGKACEVRLQPDDIAGHALRVAAGVWFRTYSVDDGYSDWKPIQAVGRPGGVFVHIKGRR